MQVMDFDISRRGRLACLACLAPFEWLLERMEKEGFHLRPQYAERKSKPTGLQVARLTLS
ncbi:MAG TPA: hypothetical protein VMT91_09105 [Anaerolineales bacterium]|nr:hypothetical protein [Anaerolineales bacterium]